MSAVKRGKWRGLVPEARAFLWGEADTKKPKARRRGSGTSEDTNYDSMNKYYRWFRQDEMVRRCEIVNAYFATLASGWETVLEASDPEADIDLESYKWLKTGIDKINKDVNFDYVLFIAQLKRSIYGKAGFEIVEWEQKETPAYLISLKSPDLKASLEQDTWQLKGWTYEGRTDLYEPNEILYYLNLELEGEYEGLSDIEPIVDNCIARHELLGENFGEIIRTLWAPYTILQADTSMMSSDDEDAFLESLADLARAGKSLAVNQSVTPITVSMNIDISGLVKMLDKFEEAIRREFGTPRFLVSIPTENRATAYTEFEAYVEGPISAIQRDLKRTTESQWFDRWTRFLYAKEKNIRIPEDEEPPVIVKMKFKTIRSQDVYQMADAVSKLWGTMGLGPLGGKIEKTWDLMGWDKEELSQLEKDLKK